MKFTIPIRTGLIALLFFTTLQTSFAATITWNGGFGFWGQANRWSSGTVPTAGDIAIINNGFCIIPNNFQASAKGVVIGGSGLFRINFNATLDLNDGDLDQLAFENNGITFNFGTISINNYVGDDPNSEVGLKNDNFFRNFPSGEIIIRNTNNNALENYIDDVFINEGLIDIDVPYDIWANSMQNLGTFDNRVTGVISIANGYVGISNPSLATHFKNFGKIILKPHGTTAIFNSDNFTNFNSGSITIVNGQLSNIGSGHFLNEGLIYSTDYYESTNYPVLNNNAFFENKGILSIYNAYKGILNRNWNGSTAVIDNLGTINIKNTSIHSIENLNIIFNLTDGIIDCDNHLLDGEYVNNGIIKNTFNGNTHTIDLTNNGIFNDKYGILPSSYTNNGLVIRPINGPLGSGQSVSNAILGAPNNNFTHGEWINKIWGGDICGNYLTGSNIFLPNNDASGEDEIHCFVIHNFSGNSDYFDVVVHNNSLTNEDNTGTRETHSTSYTVFPNPSSGTINLSSPIPEADINTFLEIFDNTGALVFNQKIVGNNEQQYQLPEKLMSGNYILRIRDKKNIVHTETLIISK